MSVLSARHSLYYAPIFLVLYMTKLVGKSPRFGNISCVYVACKLVGMVTGLHGMSKYNYHDYGLIITVHQTVVVIVQPTGLDLYCLWTSGVTETLECWGVVIIIIVIMISHYNHCIIIERSWQE